MAFTYGLSFGDVFMTSFQDNDGKEVAPHPFLVAYSYGLNGSEDGITIIGAFALSSVTSTKSQMSNYVLPAAANLQIPKSVGLKKDSQLQLDTLYLFAISKDSMPLDKKGQVEYGEWVDESKERFNQLISTGYAKINGLNLPDHPYVNQAVKALLYEYGKIWPEVALGSAVHLKPIDSKTKVYKIIDEWNR